MGTGKPKCVKERREMNEAEAELVKAQKKVEAINTEINNTITEAGILTAKLKLAEKTSLCKKNPEACEAIREKIRALVKKLRKLQKELSKAIKDVTKKLNKYIKKVAQYKKCMEKKK